METLLVKIFATALALSQVAMAPEAVSTHFDRVADQGAVAQLLRDNNNSPGGAPRRLKKRTTLPPAWIARARNVARFETWPAQQSSHNELTITWRVPPRLGGTLPLGVVSCVTPSPYLPIPVIEVIGL